MGPIKVLVIGAGFAGATAAIELSKNKSLDVTLISRSDFFEVVFANARTLVEPSIVDSILWPCKDMKPHGTFIQGDVVELTDTSAKLKDGRVLDFDFAVVATGSSYAVGKATAATCTQDRKAELQALADRVKGASKVAVVGGGPLGVELAGEVLTDLPGVEVTLVHSGPSLLPSLPAKLGKATETWLRCKGCKVVHNDKLVVPAGASGGPFSGSTAGGVQVECDVLLLATGITVNSTLLQPHMADALDASGRVKVDKHLQVVGHPRIFAVGDVTDVPEEKLAFLAAQQGKLVAANINTLAAAAAAAAADGGVDKVLQSGSCKLRSWTPSAGMQVMFVSIGRTYGVGRIGWLTLTGFIPTRIKSRGINTLVSMYRKQLLQQP